MIGLDFGNINSCVTYALGDSDLHRVPVATGNPPYDTVLASIVLDPEGDEPKVGLEAWGEYTARGGVCLRAFKPELEHQRLRERRRVLRGMRSMGHDWVHETERLVPEWRLEWTEGKYTRDQLITATSLVIARLLHRAIEEGADPDSDIWMGVPVTASTCTRKRLLCALEQARRPNGARLFADFADVLRRVHFVLEPVAVVAAAGEDLEIRGRQNVLVFDHGGGTLDLSLVTFEERGDGLAPVPVKELAAGGSGEVAGRALDGAFFEELTRDSEIAAALGEMDEYLRDQAIERCKVGLSTADRAGLLTERRRFEVDRATFERAVSGVLAEIAIEVQRTVVKQAGLEMGDVHHVVMTGGSSLVPCVQGLLSDHFSHLDEYSLLRYSPDDVAPGGGVESAITDVAQGLVRFAQQDSLEQVALWDVVARTGARDSFVSVVPRGHPYTVGDDGRPEIRLQTRIGNGGREWGSIGLYEHDLDYRYLFGMADLPPIPPGSILDLCIRRDSAFPALALYSPSGELLHRDAVRMGWPDDKLVRADLEAVADDRLLDFMHEDAEYLPDTGFRYFARAPLARKLRVDDYIEWTLHEVNGGGPTATRRRGTIEKILRSGEHEELEEMDSWNIQDFVFLIRDADRKRRIELRTCNGAVRLAPRPDKGY